GRTWFPTAIQAPELPLGLPTVQGQRCRSCRKKRRLDTKGAAVEPRRRGKVEGLEKVAPAQAQLLPVRPNDLAANAGRRSFTPKGCCQYRGGAVAERFVKQILDLFLQEAGQGLVVGINTHAAEETAVHKQGVAGTDRRPQDAPVAAARRRRLALIRAQTNERILSD